MVGMNLDFNHMKTLPKNWLESAKQNADTTNRMELYAQTEKAISFLGRNVNELDSEQSKEINDLCTDLIQGFEELPDQDKMVTWIAHNSSKNSGAYPVLHKLFETIGKIRNTTIDPGKIDSKSMTSIESLPTGLPESAHAMGSIQFSQLSLKELNRMFRTSKENQDIVKSVLIERINNANLLVNKLGLKTVSEMINFFGAKHCHKLRNIDLSSLNLTYPTDLSNISQQFPNLNHLVLERSFFSSDIKMVESSFAMMTNLNTLIIKAASDLIPDTNFFTSLKSLTTLELSNWPSIFNITWLKSLENLKRLKLSGCEKITNIQVFNDLKPLTRLDLSKCPIKDFDLKDLSSLTNLTLSRTDISSINFLKNCLSLKSLDLSGCQNLTDISAIKSLPHLRSLNLSGSNIRDFDTLQNLQSLIHLNLSQCKINNISFLKGFDSITHLNLKDCEDIKDFNVLKDLKTLTDLNLSECSAFSDISLLEGLSELTNVNLKKCRKILDLSPLEGLPKLKTLNLKWCFLDDRLDALEGKAGLKIINNSFFL